MADSLILLQRNPIPEGSPTQSVDVLAHKDQGNLYWVWTVQGIDITDTDNQVQNYLDTQVATVIAEIETNNEAPLTEEQLSNYQNIIDLQQLQLWLDTLKDDLDVIQVSSNITNAANGLKAAFSDNNAATFTAFSNAVKFELIRATINKMLGNQADEIKSIRILLKRAKRLGPGSSLSA